MNFSLDQYAPYVWSSYAIFVAMLVWDYVIPRLRLRRTRRVVAARLRREAARNTGGTP
ncbi:MAG TPA: heme exporter protein CcmD [Chiayiivirga sp.]|nr:heme exporter protein CcmD [Chiayiivirga sp.]